MGDGIAVAIVSLGVCLLAQAAQAAPIAMPTGSTVWMHFEAGACPDADGDDCVGSNQPGAAPPNGIPLTTFTNATQFGTGYAEILPARVRGFAKSGSGGGGAAMHASFQDTYTVHGSAAGSFPITVTLSAVGTGRSVSVTPTSHRLYFAAVELEIGGFNPIDTAISESARVTPFGPTSTTFQSYFLSAAAPFTQPFNVSTSYTLTAAVGGVFNLAYGVNPTVSMGEVDLMASGAVISFTLPEGVWLTSSLGGVFGSPPAPSVPVSPAALVLEALVLAAISFYSLRRLTYRSRTV